MKAKHIVILCIVMVFGSCVDNPNVTEDIYLNTPNSAKSWVNGLRGQLALTMNTILINTEMVSDNHFNNSTLYSKVFDGPVIDYRDLDVNILQQEIGRLREMADFGLEEVAQADEGIEAVDLEFMHFSRGFALLLAGENFVGLPIEPLGEILEWRSLLGIALEEFDLAIGRSSDAEAIAAYELLKARTHYRLGDLTSARDIATTLLGNTSLLFTANFDGENGFNNQMQGALFPIGPNQSFEPLPRLDFLDPKYFNLGPAASDQRPVSLAKAEEAYLIMMEAMLAENNLNGAKAIGLDLLDVIDERPTQLLDDSAETRIGPNREGYPITTVRVREDENATFKEGYILDRQAGEVLTFTVSGTKVTREDIEDASTVDELLYLVYRLRQEIFLSEGRRMNDLGIRFPVSETEQLNNPNVSETDILPVIPSFIPLDGGMDKFSVDATTGDVTILFDMNRIIVENKVSEDVVPFM
ncbi:MAG: tetratricopeptide repeat protein [Bacteroidota bacterium]